MPGYDVYEVVGSEWVHVIRVDDKETLQTAYFPKGMEWAVVDLDSNRVLYGRHFPHLPVPCNLTTLDIVILAAGSHSLNCPTVWSGLECNRRPDFDKSVVRWTRSENMGIGTDGTARGKRATSVLGKEYNMLSIESPKSGYLNIRGAHVLEQLETYLLSNTGFRVLEVVRLYIVCLPAKPPTKKKFCMSMQGHINRFERFRRFWQSNVINVEAYKAYIQNGVFSEEQLQIYDAPDGQCVMLEEGAWMGFVASVDRVLREFIQHLLGAAQLPQQPLPAQGPQAP